ncbi:hypothetical protein HMPREF0645_2566 [Hallella bergensis DSM 17361]|uniref:Uncharacterized protein n=1 Tax=Hallella bergensis DSM 17361 TaxID=585502 RepID=D1Q031_9BACT|nr:hypothetical protein HMPREF0645_2566 [Hallella bergensis DSM 17361]
MHQDSPQDRSGISTSTVGKPQIIGRSLTEEFLCLQWQIIE